MSFRNYLLANSKITGNPCETHQLFHQCAIKYCSEFGVMPPPNFHEQVLWAMAVSRDAGPEVQHYVLENLEGQAIAKNLKTKDLPKPFIDERCEGPFESVVVHEKLDCAIAGIGEKLRGMVNRNGHRNALHEKQENDVDEFFKVRHREGNSSETISGCQSSRISLPPSEPAHSDQWPPRSRPAIADTLVTGHGSNRHDNPTGEDTSLRQHLAMHAVLGDYAHESHVVYRRCAARFCLETNRMPRAHFQEQVLWVMAENPLADPEVHNYVLAMLHVENARAAVACSRSTHDSQTTEVHTLCVDAYVEPKMSSQQPEMANPFEVLGGDGVTHRTNHDVAHDEPAPPSPEQESHESVQDELEGCEAISVLPSATMLQRQGFNSFRGQAQNRKFTASHEDEDLQQYLLRNAVKGQNAHARHAHFLQCACMSLGMAELY